MSISTKKQAAIDLFGGVTNTAKAVGVGSAAISNWPDILPPRILDRVIAACVREGIEVPAHFLKKSDDAVGKALLDKDMAERLFGDEE